MVGERCERLVDGELTWQFSPFGENLCPPREDATGAV